MIDQPSPLEDRVVARLKQDGLISRPQRQFHKAFAIIALALIVPVALLTLWTSPQAPQGQQFMLALYNGPTYSPAPDNLSRAREYRDWAVAHQTGETVVTGGQELSGTARVLGGSEPKPVLAGYFILRAPSLEKAIDLARSNPHLQHGGTIVVTRIEG